MSNDDIRLDIQANITPVFQKPLAADPNQTKFSAQMELRPVFQKWLNTDLRFKDPLSADIHFTDQSLRAAQTRLQNTVLQSLKDIQIQLRGPSNPAALLKDINDLFKDTPIKLLDSDTKIDKQAITAYIRRYIAELETAIKQAPPTIQAKLELDVQHLRDELRTVQATINVGIEPDTTKLRESFNQGTATLSDGFAASVDSLVQSFAEKISSELGKPIPIKLDSDKILIDLKNTLAQFQQSAPNVLNASLQAGSAAVSQAQSGSPQSPDVFTAQLLSLSEELEAAKDLLTDPLVDLAQTIQTQVGQLTSLPDYSRIFDALTGHVEAAGQEFTHLHQTISSFRALIENTQQQTASPSKFTFAQIEDQQTPTTSEETKSIAENVQRLTDEATNGNSLDTHDHTAEALLNTAIATLNAIHAHLATNLDVPLSTINAGGGNASLANPNLFDASTIIPTNMRNNMLALNHTIDQVAHDGNWDAMTKRVTELQNVFGKLSRTISEFEATLSNVTGGLSAEETQADGQAKPSWQTQMLTKTAWKAGARRITPAASAPIGTSVRAVGGAAIKGGADALFFEHDRFREMQELWFAQSQAAEATRQLTAGQGADRRLRTQTDLTALAQAHAQSAENVADQSRTHAEQSAQNALSSTSGVTQAQERLIRLETERLKLAEQNALISKQTEQQRANAEKELQNSQAQRHQQSQLTFKDGYWTGNQLIDGSGDIIADKDELGLVGTGRARRLGTHGGNVLGLLAGGKVGATLGIPFGPLGIVIGGIIGSAAGAYVGRHGGMVAGGLVDTAIAHWNETDAQRQSRLNQEDILAHADSAWTSIGDESLKRNIQAAVDDYNKETSSLETEKFKQLNAELDAITAGVHAFGDVLPTEQRKQFQETSQQAVTANLQYAKTQAALDQLDRTSKMSDEQLKTESGREREGWFWNTTSYERVLGVNEFGKQIIATGNTFEEFQKDLAEKTKQLAPVLEARNAAAKQEAEQRRQTAMLEGHNAKILGQAAIATRAAIDAFNNALVELAKHFDDFLLNSAKQLTADARNVRYSPDSLSSTINQQRESDETTRRENTFKAQQAAIAGLGGDHAFNLSRWQEEVRYKDALRNRQLDDMATLSDAKRQRSLDIFQLEQTHKVARHQLELDQAPSEADGKKANDRGAQLRDEKNALDRKHLAERQDLEKKAAAERNALDIETQKRQMAFEMNLVKLQHEERMKGIQEEYKRREVFEKEQLAAQALITEKEENKARIKQARERGGTEYHGKSDFEVWISENAKNSARLQQDILRLREHLGAKDLKKLGEFNTKIENAGGNEFKIAGIVGQFALDTGYDPGQATASDDKAVEDARKADKLAAERVARFTDQLAALKKGDDPDGTKRVQLQASLDLALEDKAKATAALENAQRARTDNIAQQQLDFAHRVDTEAYKKKEEADQQYAKTIEDLIAKTEAKEISDDEYKKIDDAVSQVIQLSAEHERLGRSLNDKTPAAEKAKAEARMAKITQDIKDIGEQIKQELGDNLTAKETAVSKIARAEQEGAMLGNRQHQMAEGTKQEMVQNEVNARQNKERAAKEKEIQDEEEKIQAQAEAERRTLKYIREQNVKDRKDNREVLDDKLKGDMNRITSSGQLESERNRTQLATSLLGSKSGIDRMRAMGDYRANEEYNQQNTALHRRQRLEMEALLDSGGDESEKMAMEDRHAEEQAKLDSSKSIADAIRGSLGNVGSIRGLVGESVGNTSSLQEAWKRQEQSSFAHVRDKTADAITLMDRNSQVFHANLMGYLVEKLPGLLSGQQGAQVNMVRQFFVEDGGLE